jgi:hypothetical protein
VGSPEHRQERIRPPGQRARPRPSRPPPHGRLSQADFACGLCKTPFHGPSAAGHLHHGVQPGRMRGKPDGRRKVRRGAQTPAPQEPPTPVGGQRGRQREPPPVIPAGALRPVASAQPAPALSPPGCATGGDLLVPPGAPDIFFPRDGQDMGVLVFLHPQPQRPSISLDTSPVTHVAETPASKARLSLCGASCGLVAKVRSAGIPAPLQRASSLVHALGR